MAFKLAQSFHNRSLAALHGRLNQQQSLLFDVRSALPPSLANHILHCVVNEQKLLLYTDSAVWASQLRFLKQEILQAAGKSQRAPLDKLQIRILADQVTENPRTGRKANLPSEEKIAMLKEQAHETRDSQLGQALQRLSETLAKLAGE
jgi:hypothetical protein